MNEKYRRRSPHFWFGRAYRQPVGRVFRLTGPRKPHIVAGIFVWFKCRLLFEFRRWDKCQFGELSLINADNEPARDDEDDERCNDIYEFTSQVYVLKF